MKKRRKILISIGTSIAVAVAFMARSEEGHSFDQGNHSFLNRVERAIYDTPRIGFVVALSPTVIAPMALYSEELWLYHSPQYDFSYTGDKGRVEGFVWGLLQGFSFWWPFMLLKGEPKRSRSSGSKDPNKMPNNTQ